MNKHELDKAVAVNSLRLKGRTVTDFGQIFTRGIANTRKDYAALPGYVKFAKLQEETGELAEACMKVDGWVKKVNSVGTPIEEAADCFLQLIDILSDSYPDETPDRLVAALEFELMRKNLKWEGKMRFVPHPSEAQ